MGLHRPARRHPCFLHAHGLAEERRRYRVREAEVRELIWTKTSPLYAPHPASEAEANPGSDRTIDCCTQQPDEQNRTVIRVEEETQAIEAIGPRVVVEVDGAEETILRCLGEKEACE